MTASTTMSCISRPSPLPLESLRGQQQGEGDGVWIGECLCIAVAAQSGSKGKWAGRLSWRSVAPAGLKINISPSPNKVPARGLEQGYQTDSSNPASPTLHWLQQQPTGLQLWVEP